MADSRVQRDSRLIARIKEGDSQALMELMDLYAAWLTEVAMGVVTSPDLAQDVVQDVFIRLWNIRETINIHGSVPAFLYRMAHNHAQNVRKHEEVEHRAGASLHIGDDEPSTLNSGIVAVEGEEFREALNKAINQLKPRARDVFIMRAEQGLSFQEIAEALGIKIGTVYTQLYQATRQLAQSLSLWAEPETGDFENVD